MIFYLGILLGIASYSDQCTVAVYDYAENTCYVEAAEPDDAVYSEYRTYGP